MICLKHIELHIFASLISKMKKKIKFIMLLPLNSCLELLGLWSRTIDSLTLVGIEFSMDFSCSIATSSHWSEQHSQRFLCKFELKQCNAGEHAGRVQDARWEDRAGRIN